MHVWWWLSIFSAVFVIKAVPIEQAKCITFFFLFFVDRTLLGLSVRVFPKKATKIQYSTMKLLGCSFLFVYITRCVCV